MLIRSQRDFGSAEKVPLTRRGWALLWNDVNNDCMLSNRSVTSSGVEMTLRSNYSEREFIA